MKKIFLVFFLFSLLFVKTFGQSNLPPGYEIKADTSLLNILPSSYWQMLENEDGQLSFEQVSTPPVANAFHYNTSKKDQPAYAIHGNWFRYVLKNTMDHDAKISLGGALNDEQSDFYIVRTNGKVSHEVNGFLTPWNKLNGVKEYRVIPVELKPGEQVIIYNRIYNTYHFMFASPPSRDFSVGFFSTEKLMKELYTNSQVKYFGAIHDVFIFGVLAFASLFIFFFFLIIGEKVYLYFSLYLIALAVGRFNTGTEMYDVFFRQFPLTYAHVREAIWFFSMFFLNLFIRHLLNTKRFFPRWNKFLMGFNILYAVTYTVDLIDGYITGSNDLLNSMINAEQIILALSFPVTFLMVMNVFKSNKVLMYIVFPLQSIWSILWSADIFCATLFQAFNINVYKYYSVSWLDRNWYGLETILLSGLVISFSWILLQRFGDLKKQIVQKELEKEIERSQLIEQQKGELEKTVEERTAELKHSLDDLKNTQAQLIQSEKMASLGDLTAGIAHEIQNPLNFVNNFSEVSNELIEELRIKNARLSDAVGQEKLQTEKEEVNELLADIAQNLEKINFHGRRADAIVKGMLQHSRTSSGQKEMTDINSLADEYLRLAYHGLRAKEKSFDAKFETSFDQNVGEINIIPQDIGRVILNLINNACYEVNEKQKQNLNGYEPTVIVSTKTVEPPLGGLGAKVEIKVKDNGNGITHKVLDKIFQPFFTTKPTGQGTGLGLSLAYDIIKAHGGEIRVETKEGEGSEFIIQLPVV